MKLLYRTCEFDELLPASGIVVGVGDATPVGTLFEHPAITQVAIRYESSSLGGARTVTYWKEKPDE